MKIDIKNFYLDYLYYSAAITTGYPVFRNSETQTRNPETGALFPAGPDVGLEPG